MYSVQDSQAIVNFIIDYMYRILYTAPHCSHFYVLVKRKPFNLLHFDYLTLVQFIGIDKSQIIEIVEKLHLLLGTKPVATFSRGHHLHTRDRYAENNSAFKCW